VIVIDSVAALVPKAELEGEMGDTHVGLQARLMSQALRKLTGVVSKSNTALVFINQVRKTIGPSFFGGGGETTTGGMALKFYASVRLDIKKIGTMRDKTGQILGIRSRVKVVKNKLAPPFREAEFDIVYDHGISHEGCLVDMGVNLGFITKSGAWFSYGDVRLGQGRENAVQYLREHPEVAQEIEERIRQKYGLLREEAGAGAAEDTG